jgi:hypothetical protein
VPHCGKVERLEDVQHLDQHDAATRRAIGGDPSAAIGAPQRRIDFRLRCRQVPGCQQAAVG